MGLLSQLSSTRPYPQWKTKALIPITNPVSIANYQHRLTLTWVPGMQSDFRDIRFAQANGVKCPYWIDSYTSGSSATIWIKVPSANQRYLVMYYGNGQVKSESSGDNTFVFFDDFTGSSLDTTKWTSTASSGTRTFSNSLLNVAITGSGVHDCITANTDANDATVITVSKLLINNTSAKDCGARVGIKTSGIDVGAKLCLVYSSSSFLKIAALNEAVVWFDPITSYAILNCWYIFEIRHDYSSEFYSRYMQSGSWYGSSMNPAGTHLCLHTIAFNSGTTNVDYDYVYQRKYAAIEPILTVASHRPNSDLLIPYYPTLERSYGVIIW